MQNASLKAKFDDIDKIINDGKDIINGLIASSPTKTIENAIKCYIGGYAAVAICGIYESCVEEMFYIRAMKTGDKEIANYIAITMDKNFRNPDFNKIVNFVNMLDKKHGASLKKIKLINYSALDSIVNNKNSIAHGKNSTVTIDDVSDFHNRSKVIFETLEKLLC
jgi:hypothetical protein